MSADRHVTSGGAVTHNLHASCVVVGESGILIRGASGAGKSRLAAALVSQAREHGVFAAWVADDRVIVAPHGRRLVAAPHRSIAGCFEARGLGILRAPHEPRAVLRLIVDLEESVPRLPSRAFLSTRIGDVAVQRLPLVAGRVGLYETSLIFRLVRGPEKWLPFSDKIMLRNKELECCFDSA